MKYHTEWKLDGLYNGESDPQIEKDVQNAERACRLFEKKYKTANFVASPETLLASLKEYEALLIATDAKPVWYLQLRKHIATHDMAITALQTAYTERLQKAVNKVLFFELTIARIPKSQQAIFLRNPLLQKYNYLLQKIFTKGKYNLSEKEEQLLSLVSQPAEQMWYDAQSKLLNEQTVLFEGVRMPLSQATQQIQSLPKRKRRTLQRLVNEQRKSTAHLAEAELNAIYTFKKISDERRGYAFPYSETIQRYENEESEVRDLVAATTKAFSLSKKYFKIKAALLKERTISVADIYAPIGKLSGRYDFASAVDIVKTAFSSFDQKYADMLDRYLGNGQIDAYPRANKYAGGYSSGQSLNPVYVLLNHTDTLHSVETLAHEMGHSIHSELSMQHYPLYNEYTISVAEVASTFFECFVTDYLIENVSDEQRMILIDQRISRDIATVFRQIACFNCELEYHELIREKGMISKDVMARVMQKHLKSYMGEAVDITEDDAYIFTSWSHLRYSFYVYTYAYGHLISRALYERWKNDHSFKSNIEAFLSAGGSKKPKDIFKSVGVTVNAELFTAGLKGIENDIKKFEKLAKKQKLL